MEKTYLLDPEELRQAMRAWTSGVTVVTAAAGDEKHGMTVNSFTSIALDPPVIIISLQAGSRTNELISRAQSFAVTILSTDQENVSDRFAGRLSNIVDRLEGLETETLVTGAPFIKGGLAYLDCRVTQTIPIGSSTLFLAKVVGARSHAEGPPLVYHNRKYGRLVE